MCNEAGLAFIKKSLSRPDVQGKAVLEVGAYDVNGSARSIVMALNPASYMGVDIVPGPGVDRICDANHLVDQFGENAFDVVFTTEMLEHVEDWRSVISNLKRVVRPNGVLLITTRSIGYGYHQWPADFWRYEVSDMHAIFADFDIEEILPDPSSAGVFVKVKKPQTFVEKDLSDYALYSILWRRRVRQISRRGRSLLIAKERFRNNLGRLSYRLQRALGID